MAADIWLVIQRGKWPPGFRHGAKKKLSSCGYNCNAKFVLSLQKRTAKDESNSKWQLQPAENAMVCRRRKLTHVRRTTIWPARWARGDCEGCSHHNLSHGQPGAPAHAEHVDYSVDVIICVFPCRGADSDSGMWFGISKLSKRQIPLMTKVKSLSTYGDAFSGLKMVISTAMLPH